MTAGDTEQLVPREMRSRTTKVVPPIWAVVVIYIVARHAQVLWISEGATERGHREDWGGDTGETPWGVA